MDTYQTIIIAALVFTVPGLVLNWISGLKGPWAIAAAIPTTFGLYGLAAWLIGLTDARFGVGTVVVVWAILLLLALVWRGGFFTFKGLRARKRAQETTAADPPGAPRENAATDTLEFTPAADVTPTSTSGTVVSLPAEEALAETEPAAPTPVKKTRWWLEGWRTGSLLDPVWLLPAGGALVGMWLLISRGMELLKSAPHGVENIFQGWDVHWHASVVQFIGREGIASATRMGELQNIETQAEMYYPTAWHAGAALFADLANISPIAAINITAIVLAGMALPLSVALIAWRLVNNRGLTAQIAAGLGGIAVFGSPVLFWIGHYVGAWPYLAAIGVSGIVLALFMAVPYRPVAAFAAAMSLMGLTQLHPSAATIVVLGLGLWWVFQLLWSPARKAKSLKGAIGFRLRDLVLLGGAGIAGAVVLLPQILSGAEQTEEVAAFSAEENVTHAEAWEKAFKMLTRHTDAFSDFDPSWLIWLAVIGAVALLVWCRNIWAPVFYFLSVWLTANSLQPFDEPWGSWLNTIGSLHYSTAHRLVMPAAMFLFAAAAVGVAVIIRLITLAPVKKFALPSTIASVVLALIMAWVTVGYSERNLGEGADWSITASRDDRMVSDVDLRAFDWLAQQPGAYDGYIMGEPADGQGWMYAYNGLPSLNRHYQWPTTAPDAITNMLYWHGNLIGSGNHGDPDQTNHVDRGAKELGINYFFISPGNFWGFQETNLALNEGLWHAPGLTAVYQDHNVSIFAVNEAFTDAELSQMRAPGNSPVPLGPIPTKGELDRAETPAEENDPFFHRPSKPDLGGPDLENPVLNPYVQPIEYPIVEVPINQ
ncbi:DUF6541 family protein [Corynebacterium sp. A21]|uniref:DUF6541 family protein n=1 Tax=Corynebacterium sp. A21 TaxID=3457318 RepID=UPI003FD20933